MKATTSSGQQPDDQSWIEWFFSLTQAGARRRKIFLLLLLVAWGFFAYLFFLPSDIGSDALSLLYYPFSFLLDIRIFIVILVMLVCFQGILLVILALLKKPIWKPLNWLPVYLIVLLAAVGLLWSLHPVQPELNLQAGVRFLLFPWTVLIRPTVFPLLLIIALGFWIAYRIAAVYLEDIYELEDGKVARKFIRQAVFGSQFNMIEIKGGEVSREHKKSPLFRIGGPGWVQVQLDTAAVFEAVDGAPRVIGPTVDKAKKNREVLAGFEHLRSMIELTDQIEKFDLKGRTRDGIRITLTDVTVVFSVYRGGATPTLSRPYPFEPLAIRRLVYGQGTTTWWLAVTSLIRRRLGEFISRHTLSEFLAAVGEQEVMQEQQEQVDLQGQFTRLGAVPAGEAGSAATPPNFRTRPDMMTELFAEDFKQEAARKGVEIKWIGGGTWKLDDEDRVVPQRNIEAWKLSRENLIRSHPESLETVQQESLFSELARLVQEAPIHTFSEVKDQEKVTAMRRMIIAYHKIIREAYDLYQKNPDDPAQMEWLRQVLVYLTRFTARWLGGP
jgi:hypothetical protein